MDTGNSDFRFMRVDPVDGGYDEKQAKTYRNPANTELHIKSLDRYNGTRTIPQQLVQLQNSTSYPFRYNTGTNFNIRQPDGLLNGYFNQLAIVEMSLNLNLPTVITGYNDAFWVIINYSSSYVGYKCVIPQGVYTLTTLANAMQSAISALTFYSAVTITLPTAFTMTLTASVPNVYIMLCAYEFNGFTGVPTTPAEWITHFRFCRMIGANRSCYGYTYNTAVPGSGQAGTIAPVTTWTTSIANLRPTDFVDVVSNALTKYKKVKDTNSTDDMPTNVIKRIYQTPDAVFTPTFSVTNQLTTIQYTTPNWSTWSPGEALNNVDITLLDMWGGVLPWTTVNPTEISLTVLFSEN